MAVKAIACCLLCIFPLLVIVSIAAFGLSIAEIVIGAKYLNDCPAEKLIPIYLIVMGVFGILSSCSGGNSARNQRQRGEQGEGEQEQDKDKRCGALISGIVNLFVFIWFICGHVFVFRTDYTSDPNSNSTTLSYCNETLYEFAFWSIIARWIVTGLMIVLAMCACCGVGCFAICNMSSDENEVESQRH